MLGPSSEAVEPQAGTALAPARRRRGRVGLDGDRGRRPPPAARRSRTTRAARGARPAAGCHPGRAIAIAEDDPDHVVYAARNRLYESTNGGVFWQALTPELPEIEAVELREA